MVGYSLAGSDRAYQPTELQEIELADIQRAAAHVQEPNGVQDSLSCCPNESCSSVRSISCCPQERMVCSPGLSIVQNSVSRGCDKFSSMLNGERACCRGVAGIVSLGVLFTILTVGTHDMVYNNYHIENETSKMLNLHYRGNGVNDCKKTVCHREPKKCKTDADGQRTCSGGGKTCNQVSIDCTRTLYRGDRITIRNFGHLTKLGGRYCDSYYCYEYGRYKHVTNKGLKSLDWVVHNSKGKPVFTRFDEYHNLTHAATQKHEVDASDVSYMAYTDEKNTMINTLQPAYYNLRGSNHSLEK